MGVFLKYLVIGTSMSSFAISLSNRYTLVRMGIFVAGLQNVFFGGLFYLRKGTWLLGKDSTTGQVCWYISFCM